MLVGMGRSAGFGNRFDDVTSAIDHVMGNAIVDRVATRQRGSSLSQHLFIGYGCSVVFDGWAGNGVAALSLSRSK
jgi:hypothetical protein